MTNAKPGSPRFPDQSPADFTDEQKALAERISRFSLSGSKTFRGPFAVLSRTPKLGQIFLDLGEYLRFQTGIPDSHLELAVLVHAWCWDDAYEWALHYGRAMEKGVAREVVEAIRVGAVPDFTDPTEAAIYWFTRQLTENRKVEDDVFAAVREAYGEAGISNLLVFLGNYVMLSSIIAVARFEPANEAPPMLHPDRADARR